MKNLLWTLTLAAIWVVLTGRRTLTDFAVGFVLATTVTYFLQVGRGVAWLGRARGRWPRGPTLFLKLYQALDLLGFLIWQLILSNLKIAYDVATPTYHMVPAVVGVPLDVRTEAEITLLANLITLTPGTLSLRVSRDHRVLYIHAMYVTSRDEVIADVKNGFERRILKLMR